MTLTDQNRLKALESTSLLDSLPEEQFDRLTRLTSRLLGVPVALVSLVDDKRQFFKSQIGLAEPWATRRQTPLSHSFCQTVVDEENALIVSDAVSDERVQGNLAITELGVQAYCGVPLRTEDGFVLGSMCAIDSAPRKWTAADIQTLEDLADIVMTEIELRTALAEEHQLRIEKDDIARTLQAALLPPRLPDIPGLDLAAAFLPQGAGTTVGGDFYDIFPGRHDAWHIIVGDVRGKGVVAARTSMLVRDVLRTASLRGEASESSFRLVDRALKDQEQPFVAVQSVTLQQRDDQSVDVRLHLGGQPKALLVSNGAVMPVGNYGPVLGLDIETDLEFPALLLTLQPGDILVMFTDGVTDALDGMLTEDEIAAELQTSAPMTASDAVDRVVKAAHSAGNAVRTPNDDIAVVAIAPLAH